MMNTDSNAYAAARQKEADLARKVGRVFWALACALAIFVGIVADRGTGPSSAVLFTCAATYGLGSALAYIISGRPGLGQAAVVFLMLVCIIHAGRRMTETPPQIVTMMELAR